jgi:hypothetical protein
MISVGQEVRGSQCPRCELCLMSLTHLQDIAPLIGDEQHVEFFKWLIHKTDICRLDCRVLRIDRNQLGE